MSKELVIYAFLVGFIYGYDITFVEGDFYDIMDEYSQRVECMIGRMRRAKTKQQEDRFQQ